MKDSTALAARVALPYALVEVDRAGRRAVLVQRAVDVLHVAATEPHAVVLQDRAHRWEVGVDFFAFARSPAHSLSARSRRSASSAAWKIRHAAGRRRRNTGSDRCAMYRRDSRTNQTKLFAVVIILPSGQWTRSKRLP